VPKLRIVKSTEKPEPRYREGHIIMGNAIRPSLVYRGGVFVEYERSAVKGVENG
jgi:hypothetical protein